MPTATTHRMRVLPWLGSAAAAAALVAAFLWVRELASLESRPEAELTASGLVAPSDAEGSADLKWEEAERGAGALGPKDLRSTPNDFLRAGEDLQVPAGAADPSVLLARSAEPDAALGENAASKEGAARKQAVAPAGEATRDDGFFIGSGATSTRQLEPAERAAFVGTVTVDPSAEGPTSDTAEVGAKFLLQRPQGAPAPKAGGPGQPAPVDNGVTGAYAGGLAGFSFGAAAPAAGAMVFVVEWPATESAPSRDGPSGVDADGAVPGRGAAGGRLETRRPEAVRGALPDSAVALSGSEFRTLVDRIVSVGDADREVLDRSVSAVELAQVDLSAARLALAEAGELAKTARTPDSQTARTPDSPTARTPDSPTARTPDSPTARQRSSDDGRAPAAAGEAPDAAKARQESLGSRAGVYELRAEDLAFRLEGEPAQRERYLTAFVERVRASGLRVQLQRAPFPRVPLAAATVAPGPDTADARNDVKQVDDARKGESAAADAIDVLLVFRRPPGR